ncbi:MAG: hypothetical protein QM656_16045 [Paracoccaceae bacterium]
MRLLPVESGLDITTRHDETQVVWSWRPLDQLDGERSVITDKILDRDFEADRPNYKLLADFAARTFGSPTSGPRNDDLPPVIPRRDVESAQAEKEQTT